MQPLTWRTDHGYRQREEPPAWGPGHFGLFLLILILSGLAIPVPSRAQGWVEPLRPQPGAWIQRVKSQVRVEVTGNVATVVVDEWFQSNGPALGRPITSIPFLGMRSSGASPSTRGGGVQGRDHGRRPGARDLRGDRPEA
jgi:hypothetical protein